MQRSERPDSVESLKEKEATIVEVEREVHGLVPIISEVVVKGLKDLPPKLFEQHVHVLFPLFCELTIVSSFEVRSLVREVLLEQVAPLLKPSP